ncbi:hypothetical protein PIB30_091688 [Stylosanthes scabra]|uniref:RNA methyltransferase n=1 Tax=Stylosanthes scabra TaxID=79078 RepID=A0ABU6UTH1_9FABA|nr:hypothetical protein [Stylosanthes scabra]
MTVVEDEFKQLLANQKSPQEDPHLELLRKKWFEHKECLDIGCNNGTFTRDIVGDHHFVSMYKQW